MSMLMIIIIIIILFNSDSIKNEFISMYEREMNRENNSYVFITTDFRHHHSY